MRTSPCVFEVHISREKHIMTLAERMTQKPACDLSSLCMLSHFSRVPLFATLWTVAYWAPVSMGVSRQEYWHGLPCPPAGDLPGPGVKPMSLRSPAIQAGSLPLPPPGKPFTHTHICYILCCRNFNWAFNLLSHVNPSSKITKRVDGSGFTPRDMTTKCNVGFWK